MAAARSVGQSVNGSRKAVAGSPMRMAAVGVSPRRSTMALVKCVVPSITASTRRASGPAISTSSASAAEMPELTSAVVDVLT